MNKNDIVRVEITDIGTDGEGIGKADGFTLFVNNAAPGDVIDAHILKSKKTYAYAKVERIVKASEARTETKCPVASKCGGCQIQHITYKKQLEIKTKKVFDCLSRIGGVEREYLEKIFEPIIGMEEPWHYRNKAQYPVGKGSDGKTRIGFYSYHSHNIIENDFCEIQNPVCSFIIKGLREIISEFNISLYNEMSGEGVLRHCLIRVGVSTGEVIVCLVINAKGKELKNWSEEAPAMKALVNKLTEAVKAFNESQNVNLGCEYKLVSVCVNINTQSTNVILGDKLLPVYGPLYINDYIGDVRFQISPLAFYQVNPVQTKKLYDKALEYALENTGDKGLGTVWDLYCGIGTISLFLARHAKKVYGVEIIPEAIENAKTNAKINNITNAEFFVGAAEDVVPKLKQDLTKLESLENTAIEGSLCDTVVVDPPRKGCDESLLNTIVEMSPEKIVYVSCDPATLARDVKILLGKGYEIKKVCPVDQFCHSGHCETVCLLSRKAPV